MYTPRWEVNLTLRLSRTRTMKKELVHSDEKSRIPSAMWTMINVDTFFSTCFVREPRFQIYILENYIYIHILGQEKMRYIFC